LNILKDLYGLKQGLGYLPQEFIHPKGLSAAPMGVLGAGLDVFGQI
jgi:hypothetical protein